MQAALQQASLYSKVFLTLLISEKSDLVQLYMCIEMKTVCLHTKLTYMMKWHSCKSRSTTVQCFHAKQLVFSFHYSDSIFS